MEFSDHIVEEIALRGIAPKPRWHFLVTRTAFWLLACISVLIGSIAFAVAEYVFFDNDGMSIALMEKSSIYDIAQSIPFVWLVVLGLFTASSYLGFRHTRSGYKYATALVVLVSITLSVLFGLALNTVDFGQRAHEYLLHNTSFYDALIHSSDDVQD